jgi:hypothetical protein
MRVIEEIYRPYFTNTYIPYISIKQPKILEYTILIILDLIIAYISNRTLPYLGTLSILDFF